jgi:hypothetical protein
MLSFYYDDTTSASKSGFECIFYVENYIKKNDGTGMASHQFFEQIEGEYAVGGAPIGMVREA